MFGNPGVSAWERSGHGMHAQAKHHASDGVPPDNLIQVVGALVDCESRAAEASNSCEVQQGPHFFMQKLQSWNAMVPRTISQYVKVAHGTWPQLYVYSIDWLIYVDHCVVVPSVFQTSASPIFFIQIVLFNHSTLRTQ